MTTKVKVPAQINVGGHKFRIKYDSDLDDENDSGKTHLIRYVIDINPNRTNERKALTLLHELLHAIDLIYNQYDLGEKQTTTLAEGLFQVFTELGIEFDWSEVHE